MEFIFHLPQSKELVINLNKGKLICLFTSLTGLNAAVAELAVASVTILQTQIQQVSKDLKQNSVIFLHHRYRQKLQLRLEVELLSKGIAQQFSQGGLQLSENVLDLAITGDGFFPMASTDGSALYTRNGSFMLNEDNQIVNDSDYTLQVHH